MPPGHQGPGGRVKRRPARQPMPTRINLIYACAANGVIGNAGQLPWHLPEDLAHFKQQTLGAPVIMGRKTWDSLPARYRPLPGRQNIVITRQDGWCDAGAERASSLQQALSQCANAADAWVIGGAQIYALALPRAERVIVTEIQQDFAGDAYAPQLDSSWHKSPGPNQLAANGLAYRFVTWQRTSHTQP